MNSYTKIESNLGSNRANILSPNRLNSYKRNIKGVKSQDFNDLIHDYKIVTNNNWNR